MITIATETSQNTAKQILVECLSRVCTSHGLSGRFTVTEQKCDSQTRIRGKPLEHVHELYDNMKLSLTTLQSLRNESGTNQVDEQLLASWLNLRINPDVDDKKPTPGPEPLKVHQVVAHQVIVFGGSSRSSNISATGNGASAERLWSHGCASWMSLSTLNAPVVAVAGSSTHRVWCDHTDATVEIFKPRRFVRLILMSVRPC